MGGGAVDYGLVELTIVPVLALAIREVGATWRQRGALRSLERLADHHPDCARLVSRVVRPEVSARVSRSHHHRRR